MMPLLDGAGLLPAMRNAEAHRDIPCIIMSSVPEANVRERVNGYTAFVHKPFQLAAVVHLVATILSSPQPESSA
jgi:CheY-like chemotaxis protein